MVRCQHTSRYNLVQVELNPSNWRRILYNPQFPIIKTPKRTAVAVRKRGGCKRKDVSKGTPKGKDVCSCVEGEVLVGVGIV